MARRVLKAAALGLAFASISSVAQAQNVLTQGFSLGLDVSYVNQKLEDESGSGIGGGLRLGYGFGKTFQPYINLSTSKIDVDGGDYGLGHFDIGTRINLPRANSRLVPYADLAISVRAIGADIENDPDLGSGEFEATGTGFTLGGGVQYFMNSKWAFDGGLQYTIGKYGDAQWDGQDIAGFPDVDGNALRLNVGFSWFPTAR